MSMMDAFVVSGSPSHASGMAIVGVLGGRNPTLAVFPRRRGMSMNVSSTCKKKVREVRVRVRLEFPNTFR